jgi:hypothetical protein
MAVIEFDRHGIVQTANDHFLAATGYRLDEIVGKHTSLANQDRLRAIDQAQGVIEFDGAGIIIAAKALPDATPALPNRDTKFGWKRLKTRSENLTAASAS